LDVDRALELPPPVPLPPAAITANSLIASSAEAAGISFGELPSHTSGAGAESSAHDLVQRAPGSTPSVIQQPFFFDTAPTEHVTKLLHDDGEDSPREGQPDSPSTRHLSPLFLEIGNGQRRVQKRLEIEVEVTVINQDRIAQIASNKTLRTFSQLATTAVHKVAQDLRTFRESYRSVWGRRY
jgi:hypothetical protein